MEQITFAEYIKDVNAEYAKKCRRSIGDYCYEKKKRLDADFMCPCEMYEERLLCDGCKYSKGGLGHCLEAPICKRYAFSPEVSTKADPDKWEGK